MSPKISKQVGQTHQKSSCRKRGKSPPNRDLVVSDSLDEISRFFQVRALQVCKNKYINPETSRAFTLPQSRGQLRAFIRRQTRRRQKTATRVHYRQRLETYFGVQSLTTARRGKYMNPETGRPFKLPLTVAQYTRLITSQNKRRAATLYRSLAR